MITDVKISPVRLASGVLTGTIIAVLETFEEFPTVGEKFYGLRTAVLYPFKDGF